MKCWPLVGALSALAGAAAAQSPSATVAALRESGRYAEAIAAARRADLAPALAELLRMTGRRDGADSVLRRALREPRSDSLLVRPQWGLLLEDRGARDSARRVFDGFIDSYNTGRRLTADELTAVGIAVQFLSRYNPDLARDALRAYDEAIAADSGHLEAQLAVGRLFLERYNGTDARTGFEAILQRDTTQPRALLGLARTAQFEGSRLALDLVRTSLIGNPNNTDARVLHAELLAELDDYQAAREEIARALTVNPQSLPALSAQATIAWLTLDTAGYQAATRAVTALNPRYAPLYVALAEGAARHRQYADAATFARRAVARDSTAWHGWALVGINELRGAQMDSGRAHLERAFAGDPFDVWTKNTLDLLDRLDHYPERRSPRFRFVADSTDADLLAPYLSGLAERAYDTLATKYGYRPATPIRVEVFHRHADFSVRTVGLVGLGALGVSFGPVIAMDAPSAREAGAFNWGSTLWHELAHTFHLGLSKHRVPRWFTEGLAVYEEHHARPGWGDDVSPGLLAAVRDKRLPSVSTLNDGFVRPAYPEQIGYAYYLASQVCELIVAEHGFPALVRMLRAYGEGLETPAVFHTVLGETMAGFDAKFDAWLARRFAGPLAALPATGDTARRGAVAVAERARKRPNDFVAQLAMGNQLVRDGRSADAVPYLERAKTLFPQYAEEDGPYRLLATIARDAGDLRRAAAELGAMTERNERSYTAHVELAELRASLGDTTGAVRALDGAMYIDPTDPAAHARLADLAGALGNHALVARERRAIVALDPPDPAAAYYLLARAELDAGNREAARTAVLRALELAPTYDPALELLLELRGRSR